jgi:hypothetical protein
MISSAAVTPGNRIEKGGVMGRRRLEIYRRAVNLANTGKYDGWKEIQAELARQGCERTFGLLTSSRIRSALDVECERSRQIIVPAGITGSEA